MTKHPGTSRLGRTLMVDGLYISIIVFSRTEDLPMLRMRIQVAYESTPFLMDVVETDWMWKLEADIQTEVSPSNRSAATFVPQMRAFVISNNNAAVLIFRGRTLL